MSKEYKSVAIIIDNFSSQSLQYGNVNLYNFNNNEFVAQDTLNEYDKTHGDWVLDEFYSQLDDPNSTEIILIDIDAAVDGAYLDPIQFSILFEKIGSFWSSETVIESITESWIAQNNSSLVEYIPVVLSFSATGGNPTWSGRYALEYFMNGFTALVQATANVDSINPDPSNWGNTYPDVINVGAYNVDKNDNFLYTKPSNSATVDILANGYTVSGGLAGFGTSYATPNISAEIVNLLTGYFDVVNELLADGIILQSDLNSSVIIDYSDFISNVLLVNNIVTQQDLNIFGEVSYSDYINLILDLISTDIYLELDSGWGIVPFSVLSDDVINSSNPIKIQQLDTGLINYHIVDSAYEAPSINNTILTANADLFIVLEDSYQLIDVLANDIGTVLNIVSGYANNGTIDLINGNLYYAPNANFSGTDTVYYSITDGISNTWSTAAITITEINDIPQITSVEQALFLYEDATDITGIVTATDADDSAEYYSFDFVGDSAYGMFVIDANSGVWTYTLNNDLYATQSLAQDEFQKEIFILIVTDHHGDFSTQVLTIDIIGVNDVPVANSDTATVKEDAAVIIDVLANDSDIDNNALGVISASAENGIVVVNTDTTLTYTPNLNYNGVDTISYTIDDGYGGIDKGLVSVDISAIDDTTILYNDKILTNLQVQISNTTFDINNGFFAIDQDVNFNYITLSNESAYQGSTSILDMYDTLDLIGQDVNTIKTHAADINNDDIININDLYAIIGDIGSQPGHFDLIDQNGNRINQLNSSLLDLDNQLTLVANGDVDLSGSFNDQYFYSSELL